MLSLGEAKWDKPMGTAHVERLRRARDLLAVKGFDTRDAVLTCYSGAGFAPDLRMRDDVALIGLDLLYRLHNFRAAYASPARAEAEARLLAAPARCRAAHPGPLTPTCGLPTRAHGA